MTMKPVDFVQNKVTILDQTRLPQKVVFVELKDYRDVARAIKEMRVRGAPAIGVTAAYGVALGAQRIIANNREDFLRQLVTIFNTFRATRPTAVNLFRTLDRMKRIAEKARNITELKEALEGEARRIHSEEEAAMERLSQIGAQLIEDGFSILTHCNTGALATAGYGTAQGVIRAAWKEGKRISVLATETRPLLQGARLTTWELLQEEIPVTLITDSMAGYFMKEGKVNCVIVGADRIAANGDVANKIGTYTLAVLAMENGIPFYVAATTSSIDLSLSSGDKIPVEERSPEEVTFIQGVAIAPKGVKAANPAFDVTPHFYVSAIITEKGIATEPYEYKLKRLLEEAS